MDIKIVFVLALIPSSGNCWILGCRKTPATTTSATTTTATTTPATTTPATTTPATTTPATTTPATTTPAPTTSAPTTSAPTTPAPTTPATTTPAPVTLVHSDDCSGNPTSCTGDNIECLPTSPTDQQCECTLGYHLDVETLDCRADCTESQTTFSVYYPRMQLPCSFQTVAILAGDPDSCSTFCAVILKPNCFGFLYDGIKCTYLRSPLNGCVPVTPNGNQYEIYVIHCSTIAQN